MSTTKNNSGNIFSNLKPTHKDYEGSCMVDGKPYWIAGWIHESETAGRYLSLEFTAKETAGL